jgi:putative flippase GtrA
VKHLVVQIVRYAAASVIALVADISILWALVYFFSCPYLAAAGISFLSGMCVIYLLSVKLVFDRRMLQDRRAEFLIFLAIGAVGLAINLGVMAIAVTYLGLHYLAAKSIAAACTFICNFTARRELLFGERSFS